MTGIAMKRKRLDSLLEKAAFQTECYYPNWRTHDNGKPICIPSALDVNTFFHGPRNGIAPHCSCLYCYEYFEDEIAEYLLAKQYRRKTQGDDAELFFFNCLQTTKQGGILIANLKLEDFKSTKMRPRLSHLREFKIFCKDGFEMDFIFLHRKIGILVIEVKSNYLASSKRGKNVVDPYSPYDDAHDALLNYVEKIRQLVEICMENGCSIPVHGAICFPNADMASIDETGGIWHIDYNTCKDMDNFFLQKIQPQQDYFERQNFDKFVGILINIKDIMWYSREGDNVFEIYRKIERQDFLPKDNSPTPTERMNESPIFLNSEQKLCFNSSNKQKILCGLPGTGKTLLVMLHVQQAAMIQEEAKTENVRIIAVLGANRLSRNYQRFFSSLIDHHKTKVSIKKEERPKYKCISECDLDTVLDIDHFFADEVPGVIGEWEEFLAKRSQLSDVFTVVSISGRSWVENSYGISLDIKENANVDGFAKFQFRTIVRGTVQIIRYWANKYLGQLPDLKNQHPSTMLSDKPPSKVQIGHSIIGTAVDERIVATTNEILTEILQSVQSLLGNELAKGKGSLFQATKNDETSAGDQTNRSLNVFRRGHIAILTNSRNAVTFIGAYLNCFGYRTEPTGGANSHKIKLDLFYNTPSQEYPVVILVNYYGHDLSTEAMELTVASRAIARLIVLKRDRMIIQHEIDKIIEDELQKSSIKNQYVVTSELIKFAVHKAGKNVNETFKPVRRETLARAVECQQVVKEEADHDVVSEANVNLTGESALELDKLLASVRYNVIPPGVQSISCKFSECQHFSDVLSVLCNVEDNPELLEELVKANASDNALNISALFVAICLANCSRSAKLCALDFKDNRAKIALTEFYEKWETQLKCYLKKSDMAANRKSITNETEPLHADTSTRSIHQLLPIINWSAIKADWLDNFVHCERNSYGVIAEVNKFGTISGLMSEIRSIVKGMLYPDVHFRPCHITILATDMQALEFIAYQYRIGYKTDGVRGIKDSKIKLDRSKNILLQKYPIPVLLMVNLYGYKLSKEEIDLTLTSRAFSRLIVFERDPTMLQRAIDKVLSTCQATITHEIIGHAFRVAAISIGEAVQNKMGQFALKWDEAQASVRYNVIPKDVRNILHQQSECQHFSDVLSMLCNFGENFDLLAQLVKTNESSLTLYCSVLFVLNRLVDRDNAASLHLLNLKDIRVKTALVTFYEQWEIHWRYFNSQLRDRLSRTATDSLKTSLFKWRPFTQVLTTLG